jgi:hypothetical protein
VWLPASLSPAEPRPNRIGATAPTQPVVHDAVCRHEIAWSTDAMANGWTTAESPLRWKSKSEVK